MADSQVPTALAWYKPEIGSRLMPIMRHVFQSYSGIPDEKIEGHISRFREQAWNLFKYPCIGQWQFLYSYTPHLPVYDDMVTRIKGGASILDLGCCFGQDLRILAAEGLPTKNMYASDIRSEFWEISYGLFNDRETMQAQFLQADIFDPKSALNTLRGSIDIVLATHFIHLFSWEQQVEALKSVVSLCKPGAIVVGFNIGFLHEKDVPAGKTKGSVSKSSKFYHDTLSFQRMWRQIESETGTSWLVDVHLSGLEELGMPKEDFQWMDSDARGLSFTVIQQQSKS